MGSCLGVVRGISPTEVGGGLLQKVCCALAETPMLNVCSHKKMLFVECAFHRVLKITM